MCAIAGARKCTRRWAWTPPSTTSRCSGSPPTLPGRCFPLTLNLDDPRFLAGLERLRRISVATSAARQRGGLLGAVKRVGLGLAAGLTFARLYCLPTKPNPLPANARLAPTW